MKFRRALDGLFIVAPKTGRVCCLGLISAGGAMAWPGDPVDSSKGPEVEQRCLGGGPQPSSLCPGVLGRSTDPATSE